MSIKFKISLSTITLTLVMVLLSTTYAHAQEKVNNLFFSFKVPKTWTYTTYATETSPISGKGPQNDINLAPDGFSELLLNTDKNMTDLLVSGGAWSQVLQDTFYPLKDSPLEAYIKYQIDGARDTWNVTSIDNGTIANEKAVKISSKGTDQYDNLRKVEYLLLHGKDAYLLQYMANSKDYEKYLPEFEQMVKSFRFKN